MPDSNAENELRAEVRTPMGSRQYDSKNRFVSYWHQIDEILERAPGTVLEIGSGNGFTAGYLRRRGIDISTLDVNESLKPDYVGSVLDLPFPDRSFDMVVCFEALEHLPYESVSAALANIRRVAARYSVISLPDRSRTIRIHVDIPRLLRFRTLFAPPQFARPHSGYGGGHCWEIGRVGFPLKRVTRDIEAAGFTIESTFRIFENPLHRFFRLSCAAVDATP